MLVAFSGGLDSSALLHLLAHDPTIRDRGLRAIHVHHGLHARADVWAEHCAERCLSWGVALEVAKVEVCRDSGLGPEAAARQARRQAFAQALRSGETLALAQHRDDQAETFLLRALRASGPDGLAAMRPWRRFAGGWMWRPLLDTPRDTLADYAAHHGLRWIEDPSNADTALDRNFLRHRVLPLLHERWPHADAAFARSAALAADASGLLVAQDEALLASVREGSSGALSVPTLCALPVAQRARVLRHWVAILGWPPLPAEGVARIEADLLGTGSGGPVDGRTPRFAWRKVEIRRWRDALHPLDTGRELPPAWSCLWDGSEPLALPNGGSLMLAGAERFPAPLEAHARRGGERILPPGHDGHHRTLKHLLQDSGVPPWERARMPLLSTGDGILLAAGDAIRSAGFGEWLESQNARLVWNHR